MFLPARGGVVIGAGRQHRLLLALVLVFYAGYVFYPMLSLIAESLRDESGLTIDRYAALLDPARAANREAVANSILVSVLSVAAAGGLGLLLAFALSGERSRSMRSLRALAILPIALPPLVGVTAFLFVFGEGGIIPRFLQELFTLDEPPFVLEGRTAIVAVHAYSFNVYFYLFCSAALRTIDLSTLEAARGLGAGTWMTLRRVVLPELRPAMLGAAMLTFMASMASFSAPLVFGGDLRFVTTQIYATKLNGDMSLAAAQSVMLVAVSAIAFVLLRGRLPATVRGATKGASRTGGPQLTGVLRTGLRAAGAVVILLEMLPLAVLVLVAFAREGSWTTQLLPSAYTADNFRMLFGEPSAWAPVANSLIMTAMAVGVTLIAGVSAAYLVVFGLRSRRASGALDLALTLPYAFPGTVVGIALILAFSEPTVMTGWTPLVGTFWILPLGYAVRMYPLVLRSSSSAMQKVDPSVLEAAGGLGAPPWGRMRKILLPLALPGIVSGGLLVALGSLGEFVSSVLLYSYDSRPISVEILSQLRMFSFGGAAVYCVVLLILMLAMVAAADRLRRGRPGEEVW